MHLRKLFVALALSVPLAWGAAAQTTPDAGTSPAPSKKNDKRSTPNAQRSTKKKKARKAPPPAPKSDIDEETRKALESMSPTPTPPATTPPAEAPAAPVQEASGPADDDPPVIKHTPVTGGKKGKPVTVTAHATDPAGVFGPILYLRKKGLASSEYIPMRMSPSKTGAPGDYSLDIPAALTNVDGLEYYIEVWDNAGNGPVRAGAAESPMSIKLEEEKKVVVTQSTPQPPPNVTIRPKGAPPAITHTAVTHATKGQSIEINARIAGDTGVQGPTVMFRHVGEKEYKTLPMGNVGGDDYTATVPAAQAGSDIEYYVEGFDKYGNGPGRSGAPNIPYVIKVSDAHVGGPMAGQGQAPGSAGPRVVKAPFRPNPGRAAAWLLMGGFVGGLVFAGGESFASWQEHNAYTHTFTYEGRLRPDLLDRANLYGKRAKTAAIIGGASLVASIVLLVIFPEHSDTMVIGSGGDVGVRF